MAKNSWRATPQWRWAWPYADEAQPQYQHMAQVLSDNGDPRTAAIIYLPQPANVHGWAVHPIYADPPPEPPRRRLGL